MLGQLLAAIILVISADVQIPSMFGLFGVGDLPIWVNYILTLFTILVIINSFNLIDGINGLSSGITLVICTFFGIWFFLVGRIELSILAVAMMGSLVAFLKFNWSPAKIFMGDSGSLICGLVVSILAIEFIEMHTLESTREFAFSSVPAVAIGVLIIPLFDTLRVFIMRTLKGRSPFYADKRHIHHLLLDIGFKHIQASLVLVGVNVLFIVLVYFLQGIGTLNLIFVILFLMVSLTLLLENIVRKRKKSSSS